MADVVCRWCRKSFHELVREDAYVYRVKGAKLAGVYFFDILTGFGLPGQWLTFLLPLLERNLSTRQQRYNPNRWANGAMLRLKPEQRKNGWSSFYEATSSYGPALICPGCGGQYADGKGRIITTAHICDECGQICDHAAGLMSHKRRHRRDKDVGSRATF
jgi:hypothetical protein